MNAYKLKQLNFQFDSHFSYIFFKIEKKILTGMFKYYKV